MHEDFTRTQHVRGSSDRSFGLVFAIFFSLIGAWPMRVHQPPRIWALATGGAFFVVALIRPAWLHSLNQLWMKLGLLLGRIMNPIVTGLLFFVVVTPTGLLFRLLRKDPLRLARNSEVGSYWIERRPPGPPPTTMPQQF